MAKMHQNYNNTTLCVAKLAKKIQLRSTKRALMAENNKITALKKRHDICTTRAFGMLMDMEWGMGLWCLQIHQIGRSQTRICTNQFALQYFSKTLFTILRRGYSKIWVPRYHDEYVFMVATLALAMILLHLL